MLIAVCGIDGAGKTTQIQFLKEYMENEHKVMITKQPTDFYRSYDRFKAYVNRELKEDKTIIHELALLSAADKLRHYQLEISEFLEEGVVISDRYVFSAYAYFLARGIDDIDWLREINKYLPIPDLTFYIDIDPNLAYERIIARDGKYTKKEETDVEVLSKVRNCFVNQPWGKINNYFVIDGKKSQKEIHESIRAILKDILAKGGK